MCGIVGILGRNWNIDQLNQMINVQKHRGPDASGFFVDPSGNAGFGHNRLSIIDLSEAGRQPMQSSDGNLFITFNGEIYNYLELRRELESEFSFRTHSDTEVLLAAFQKWGAKCLDRLIGMFSFIIWDQRNQKAFVARDRFGVKPLYYHQLSDGTVFLASEIKTIHAAGIERQANPKSWANYLAFGIGDGRNETFWKGISALPAGHYLNWENGKLSISKWYDLAEKTNGDFDLRSDEEVQSEYLDLLKESVKFRFRADVPVGINLSGGLDSSTLLGLVHTLEKEDNSVAAYTFTCGDERYDELPWVKEMLKQTNHPLFVSTLTAEEIPQLAAKIKYSQDEPFGGFPTLAYSKIFENARKNGTIVLLDGNGMDEQWAGYDYYQSPNGSQPSMVQGSTEKPVRPECLEKDFLDTASPLELPSVFPDKLRNIQYRDVKLTKIPRAMRYNDRISMRYSTELREPFLDHRLFELAFRQPAERKIAGNIRKKTIREIAKKLLPNGITEAPKRPLQTPQREWLRGELRQWANDCITKACDDYGGVWLNSNLVMKEWDKFCSGASDNSFYVWQWIELGLPEIKE